LSLTFFRTNVSDFIERDNTTRLFENNQRYRFQGIEMSLDTKATDDVRLRFGYTYLDAYDESPSNDGVRLQYRPRHKASAQMYWTFVPRWSLYGGVLYVADQIANSRGSAPTGQLNLGEYTVVDLKLNWQVPTTTANLYVGADNVLDENYQDSYAFPQSGRFVYAGASVYF
jgi:vitamin B12 transporter